MKPWKAALGIGAACAACCAVPLLSGAAALTAGSATLAAAGAALLACTDELVPLAWVLSGLATVGAGAILWRRPRARATAVAPACSVGPKPPQAAAPKACGCAPAACG